MTVRELPDRPNPAGGLTARQKLVLEAIITSIDERGFPPSVRDICDAAGLASASSAAHQLQSLEKLGYIKRGSNLARGIEVLRDPDGVPLVGSESAIIHDDSVTVGLIGEIAAGTGVLADQQFERNMTLPRELTGSGDLFMLKVKGDSMIDAGIFDGDFVVVRSQPTANNGDIVAALLDGEEATVKTYKRRDGQVWLMPHNPAYEPINGNEARIMGIVKTVLRKLD